MFLSLSLIHCYIKAPPITTQKQYEEILQMLSLLFLESLPLECSRSLKHYNYHPCKSQHQRQPFVNVTAWKLSNKVIILSSKCWKSHSSIFTYQWIQLFCGLILFSDYKRKPALSFFIDLFFELSNMHIIPISFCFSRRKRWLLFQLYFVSAPQPL